MIFSSGSCVTLCFFVVTGAFLLLEEFWLDFLVVSVVGLVVVSGCVVVSVVGFVVASVVGSVVCEFVTETDGKAEVGCVSSVGMKATIQHIRKQKPNATDKTYFAVLPQFGLNFHIKNIPTGAKEKASK